MIGVNLYNKGATHFEIKHSLILDSDLKFGNKRKISSI